jgi:glycosyltransferase involved in cell wall biosynthesis
MSVPLILCIMPTCNRDSLAKRAIRCFKQQAYQNKELSLINAGGSMLNEGVPEHWWRGLQGSTTGVLRNKAIEAGSFNFALPDFIAHFDDDDISAPDRLQRQLEHIQRTGKLVTGFYDMPMYDARKDKVWIYRNDKTNYALGTSLFYRREAWERVKFPDKTPEDNIWRHRVGLENCESQSVFREDGTPMMVQVVHGGNASARIFAGTPRFKEASAEQEKAVRALIASA